MSESLFWQDSGLRHATLLKKRLWHRCFPANFVKFSEHLFYRTPVGEVSLYWDVILKKRLHDRCFPENFTKFSRTPISCNICSGFFCDYQVLKWKYFHKQDKKKITYRYANADLKICQYLRLHVKNNMW